jgi:hypothetical protein
MEIPGIKYTQTKLKDPLYNLPENWEGMKIGLKMVGGVGDCCIAIGGTAKALKEKYDCHVIAITFDHRRDFVELLEGVDASLRVQELNDPLVRQMFDVILDFQYAFNNSRQLLARNYYELVSKKIGLTIKPGKLNLTDWGSINIHGRPLVAVHPGASNPNRRWIDSRWLELTEELIKRGFGIVWLGTSDELGFIGDYSYKLSEFSDSIHYQSWILTKCQHFIGCDSGFSHIAGLLGIPGSVLFTATEPRHVIAEYPSLKGISKYTPGLTASRSLRGDDPVAEKVKQLITAADILESLGFDKKDIVSEVGELKRYKRPIVGILAIDQKTELYRKLQKMYEVVVISETSPESDIPIFFYSSQGAISVTFNGRIARINSLEEIDRSLREMHPLN